MYIYTMYKFSGAVQGDGGIGCDGSPHSYLPIFIQVAPHSSPNVSIQLTSAVAQRRAMVALDGLVPLTLISYPPIMCNLSCACHGAHHCSPTAVVNYQIVLANYLPPHFVVDISPQTRTIPHPCTRAMRVGLDSAIAMRALPDLGFERGPLLIRNDA